MIWRSVRARWLGYVAALAAVAVVSGFIGVVLRQVNLANVSMLYLLAVLATAVAYGGRPGRFCVDRRVSHVRLVLRRPDSPLHGLDRGGMGLAAVFPGHGHRHWPTCRWAAPTRTGSTAARTRGVVLYDVVRLVGEQDLEDGLRRSPNVCARSWVWRGWRSKSHRRTALSYASQPGDDDALKALQAGTLSAAHVLNAGQGHRNRPALPGAGYDWCHPAARECARRATGPRASGSGASRGSPGGGAAAGRRPGVGPIRRSRRSAALGRRGAIGPGHRGARLRGRRTRPRFCDALTSCGGRS